MDSAKNKKFLHPNSRKSKAIFKKAVRKEHKQKNKLGNLVKQSMITDKLLWIQQNMIPNICPYTEELLAELLEKYIKRNDEELEQISLKHSIGGRKNRQHASREDIVLMNKKREQEEYDTCGIEIPDVLNAAQCSMLRNWDGNSRLLQNFKFRRFSRKQLNDTIQKQQKNLSS